MDRSKNFQKNFWWNIIGTGFNSFNSLFLMVIVTRLNGMNEAGVFTLAFSTACILYVIGSYSGRVYQVTESNKSISDKDYLASRLIAMAVMMIAVLFFVGARGYGFERALVFILLALFKALEAFSDVLYGVLQKEDLLYKVGQSYFLKSCLTLGIFLAVDIKTKNMTLAICAVLLVWVLCILFYDLPASLPYVKNSPAPLWKNIWFLFKDGFFVFAILFMGIYMTNASKYAIDNFLGDEKQTIFGILIMPATAVCLFGQFIFHPYLGRIAELNAEGDYKKLYRLIHKVILMIMGIGVVCVLGAFFLGIPVLNFIYGLDISPYKGDLLLIIVAATLYNMGGTFSNMLTTMRITKTQFVMYLVFVAIAWTSANILTYRFGIHGAVAAYGFLMVVFVILYAVVSRVIISRKIAKKP